MSGKVRCSFSTVEAKKLIKSNAAIISTLFIIHLKHNSRRLKLQLGIGAYFNGVNTK